MSGFTNNLSNLPPGCSDADIERAQGESELAPAPGSAFATAMAALKANVIRFYDLCLIAREAKEEMKLLNEQFSDICANAAAADAVEWLLSGRDMPGIREWEAAHPGWVCSGNGIRKVKQNA